MATRDLGEITVGPSSKTATGQGSPGAHLEEPKDEKTRQILDQLKAHAGPDGIVSFDVPKSSRHPEGHKVKIREPEGSAEFRATAMVPPDRAALTGLVQQILFICEIDGVAIPPPVTLNQAQAIADKLGDEGLLALRIALMEAFPVDEGLQGRMRKLQELRGL